MAKKGTSQTRRAMVKKTAYVVPAILTLAAAPRFAQAGSKRPNRRRTPSPRDRG
jgi:hypothetical protein